MKHAIFCIPLMIFVLGCTNNSNKIDIQKISETQRQREICLNWYGYRIDTKKAINDLKPPVFWKDKPKLISQAKVWDKKKIKLMMKDTYNIEIKIKSSLSTDKQILIKKLLIDMCELANAS